MYEIGTQEGHTRARRTLKRVRWGRGKGESKVEGRMGEKLNLQSEKVS